MKSSSIFVCSDCGATSPKWLGKCPSCNKFGTLIEEIAQVESEVKSKNSSALSKGENKAVPLSKVRYDVTDRISSGVAELDNVLGGGIVKGSLVLIGGDPGIGKSTLLTQVSGNLSSKHKVLYVSAEESCSQLKMRTERLGVKSDELLVVNETCLEDIEPCLEGIEICIIDSIQTIYTSLLSSASGSVGQVRECASKLQRIAKSRNITFFIVGHVTKEGSIAGPKVLEHIMDTVLYFEGEKDENFKILRSVKNRFGSVQEVGVFEMTGQGLVGVSDYTGLFLSDSRGKSAGSVVIPTETGNRCMLVEIQTLLARTAYGLPRRMQMGIDYNKLILLIAVLEKRCGVPFYDKDVYINAMGGIKINEPACDLTVCTSLYSAYVNKPLDGLTAVFGEVGLTGEIRAVSFAEKRVQECVKLGFKRVIMPLANAKNVERFKNQIEILPLKYISELRKVFEKMETERE